MIALFVWNSWCVCMWETFILITNTLTNQTLICHLFLLHLSVQRGTKPKKVLHVSLTSVLTIIIIQLISVCVCVCVYVYVRVNACLFLHCLYSIYVHLFMCASALLDGWQCSLANGCFKWVIWMHAEYNVFMCVRQI